MGKTTTSRPRPATGSRRASSSRSGAAGSRASAPAAAPPANPNGASAQHLGNIPAESAEAKAQAERDRTGKTRPGYTRRDLATTSTFNGVTYQAGANREVPISFADHLDLINVSPDASTEANRETKFGGGKEDDQDAQGKAVKAAREAAPAAQRKHRESDAFKTIGEPKKSGGKK